MKKYISRLFITPVAFLLLSYSFSYAQEISPLKSKNIKNGNVRFAEVTKTPKGLISPDLSQWLIGVLEIEDDFSFKVIEKHTDKYGMLHVKLQQYLFGYPIEGMVYMVHYSRDGEIAHISGNYTTETTEIVAPIVDIENGFGVALQQFQISSFAPGMELNPKRNGEIVYLIKSNILVQCYRFEVVAERPILHNKVYVNTQNLSIESNTSLMRFGNEPVTVETYFNGNQTIITESIPEAFRLHDYTRGNGIQTFDLNEEENYAFAVDFIDSAGTWSLTDTDKVALDVHYSMEKAYDFFYEKFERNSYTGTGSVIKNYVHYSQYYRNAFFTGEYFVFGDGFGVGSFSEPYASTDIVAHEYTHGVVKFTAGFDYLNESGALEESFCDIFGIAVDFYANPQTANWEMGDRGESFMLRSLKEPKRVADPDTYMGEYWITDVQNDNGGVHSNSGIQNYWFYLLCEGGEGYNDNGDYYVVDPIGMEKALDIAYQTLTVYMGSSSVFDDACFYSIQSTKDIYGECSSELKEVTNAWYAVGLHEVFDTAVIADFELNNLYYCSVPAVLQPINNSINATSFEWRLNDQLVSTDEDPSIGINTAGSYALELIANGSYGCWTTDTVQLDSIYVKQVNDIPIGISCSPADTSKELKHTIDSIKINGQIFRPQKMKGYIDLSCFMQFNAMEGSEVKIEVWHPTEYTSTYSYWLDKNNNGVFEEDEHLVSKNESMTSGFISDSIFIDAVTDINIPLRLRLISDAYSENPCEALDYNTSHDYGLIVTENSFPPIARVAKPSYTVGKDLRIEFTENSLHKPDSYEWYFEKAIPSLSTEKSPKVKWDSVGVYDVALIVSNAFGTDTLILEDYIEVLPAFFIGTNTGTNLTHGILYDSGGDSTNYGNNENFQFLIDSPCDSLIEVTIHYTQFNEGERLALYNNKNQYIASQTLSISSSLEGYYKSFTGSQVLITFESDADFVDGGFAISWKSLGYSTDQSPIAGFTIDDVVPAWNQPVQMLDTSLNVNKIRQWYINDIPETTENGFEYRFTNTGVNQIKLKVQNCVGYDSVTKLVQVDSPSALPLVPTIIELGIEAGVNLDTCIILKNTSSHTMYLETSVYENDSVTRLQFLGLNIIVTGFYDSYYTQLIQHLESKGANVNFVSYFNLTTDTLSSTDLLFFDANTEYVSPIIQDYIAGGGKMIMANSYFSPYRYGSLLPDLGVSLSNPKDLLLTGVTTNLDTLHPVLNGVNEYNIQLTGSHILFTDNGVELINDSLEGCFMAIKYFGLGNVLMAVDDIYENLNYSIYANKQIIDNYIHWSILKSKLAQYPDQNYKLKPDSSVMACVQINTDNVFEGSYPHTLDVNVNDPAQTTLTVPIIINVTGKGEFEASADTLEFGVVLFGNTRTLPVELRNIGTDSLIIDSVRINNNEFAVSSIPDFIQVADAFELEVTYTPSSANAHYDSLIVFTSNSDITKHVIILHSESILPPDIELSESLIEITLLKGTTDNISVLVENKGNSELVVDGSFVRKSSSTANIYHSRYLDGINIYILGDGYYSDFTDTLRSLGANINMISHSEDFDSTYLKYTDILVFNYMSNYGVFDYSSPIDTSAADAIKSWLLEGGSIFIDGYLPYKTEFFNYLMEDSGIKNPVSTISALYTDVQPHFITHWVDTMYSPEKWFAFDVIDYATPLLIDKSDNPVVVYDEVGEGQVLVSGCRLGLDHIIGQYNNYTFLINAMEYLVGSPVWIKIKKDASNSIAVNETDDIQLHIDASYLNVDDYSARLEVFSNDPDELIGTVDVLLHVREPKLEIADTLYILDTKLGDQKSAELVVVNEASSDVLITSFTNECGEEIVFPQTEMLIKNRQTTKIIFTYIPLTVTQDYCHVTLHTDDPYQPEINVTIAYSSLDTISSALHETTYNSFINIVPMGVGVYKVETDNSQILEQVNVYSSAGQLVVTGEIINRNEGQIDISSQMPGVYLVEIKTNNTKVVKKLMRYR